MNLITPDWPAPAGIRAFCTTRAGGFSKAPYHGKTANEGGLNFGLHVNDDPESVKKNRALLRKCLPSEPAWLNQVHSADVVNAAEVSGTPAADASFALEKDTVCAVMTADCLPVLFCTADGKAIAAAHAGWRGLAAGVLENTVSALRGISGSEILAWMGPAIGPEAFEVGEDVREAYISRDRSMDAAFAPRERKGKYLADIFLLAEKTLRSAGVSRIYGGGLCTFSDPERFYSFRRDGVTGRMASVIWISS